jgi:hypothetical protein
VRSAALAFALIALIFVHDATAKAGCGKADCAAIREEIRNIESRMRAGYTRAQGERYEERLRKLKEKRRRLCR